MTNSVLYTTITHIPLFLLRKKERPLGVPVTKMQKPFRRSAFTPESSPQTPKLMPLCEELHLSLSDFQTSKIGPSAHSQDTKVALVLLRQTFL